MFTDLEIEEAKYMSLQPNRDEFTEADDADIEAQDAEMDFMCDYSQNVLAVYERCD